MGILRSTMQLKNCPQCGKRLPSNIKSCPDCSFEFQNNSTISNKKSYRKIILIVFSLLMLVGVVCGIYILCKPISSNRMSAGSDSNGMISESLTSDTKDILADSIDINVDRDNTLEEKKDLSDELKNTEKNKLSEDASVTVFEETAPIGVYISILDNMETIVINDDGLAYYYYDSEFFELAIPWTYENNEISIPLSKLHCTIKATVDPEDPSNLTFTSDSINWNTFTASLNEISPKDYLKRTVLPYDDDVEVTTDGSMLANIGNMTFEVPKNFRNSSDVPASIADAALFIDTNPENLYSGGLVITGIDWSEGFKDKEAFIFPDDKFIPEEVAPLLEESISGFCEKFTISNPSETYINGIKAITYDINGYFNRNFGSVAGYNSTGKTTVFNNAESHRFVIVTFLENTLETYSNLTNYQAILDSAIKAP